MKTPRRIALFLALLALLAFGCEVEELEDLNDAYTTEALRLSMSLPYNGQQAMVPSAHPIVVFGEALDADSVQGRIALLLVDDKGETDVAFDYTVQGRSLRVAPQEKLQPLSEYIVRLGSGITSESGLRFAGGDIRFSTGAKNPIKNQRPYVLAYMPVFDGMVFDFATFWVHFSEPIETKSLVYGSSVKITRVSDGQVVPASIWPGWTLVSIDPVDDLEPGELYKLELTGDIVDRNGEMLEPFEWEFTPLTTGDTSRVVVMHCPTAYDKDTLCGNTDDPADLPQSPITGLRVNTFISESLLMGSITNYVTGYLDSDMAEQGLYETVGPMRIPKGTKLWVSPIDVSLGGEIPTGVCSDEIEVTFVTDAYGFMFGSEMMGHEAGGDPAIYMIIDTSMVAENPTINSMLAQNILCIQLVGTAKTDPETGDLILEVAAMTDLQVLDEFAPLTVSLNYITVPVPTDVPPDETLPSVLGTGPLPASERVSVTDPIYVFFSEPLEPSSAQGKLHVTGGDAVGHWKHRGPTSVFYPEQPLEEWTLYTVTVEGAVQDLVGNSMGQNYSFSFRTRSSETSVEPPILGTTTPGDGDTLPANMPVDLFFGQAMDADSIAADGAISINDLTAGREVGGSWVCSFHQAQFLPNNAFEVGHDYRMTVTERVKSFSGVPLDTDVNRDPGGPDKLYDFSAVEPVAHSPLALLMEPVADTDDSGYIDGAEMPTDVNYFAIDFPLIGDPSYSTGIMLAWVRGIEDDGGRKIMAIDLTPGILMHASSTSIELPIKLGGDRTKDDPSIFDMGRISIDLLDTGFANVYGGPNDQMLLDLGLNTFFNIENDTLNEFLVHDLPLDLEGDLYFTPDGRMETIIAGETTIAMEVPIIGRLEMPTTILMRAVSTIPKRP